MAKLAFTVATIVMAFFFLSLTGHAQRDLSRAEMNEAISKIISETQSIKIGMTRGDLLQVFTTEGGLSTPLSRTYVHRDCLYIKVDVEFEPVTKPDSDGWISTEDDGDLIKSISRPYLAWANID